MTFAERLRQLREQGGMTQEQLADRSEINLWTIRGYEQGRREPNWKGAIALAAALGVAVEAFADCVESTPTNRPASALGRPRKASLNAEATETSTASPRERKAPKRGGKGKGKGK
jgi:transcriptional regulator with XRE-family HTH domain